jgi:tetratricopeptide (TPR) repeat protein
MTSLCSSASYFTIHRIQIFVALILMVFVQGHSLFIPVVRADDEALKQALGGLAGTLIIKQALKSGDKKYARGDYQGALDDYQGVLKMSNTPSVHARIGNAYVGLNKMAEAAASYQQALQMDNKLHFCYAGLGRIAQKQKDYPRALEQFRQALALSPREADYHDDLGSLYFEQGQWAEAIAAYENAVRYESKSPDFRSHLAAALCQNKQYDKALSTAEVTIKAFPNHAPAYRWRALAAYNLGRAPEATAALEQYLKLDANAANDEAIKTLWQQIKSGALPTPDNGVTLPALPTTPNLPTIPTGSRPSLYGKPSAVIAALSTPAPLSTAKVEELPIAEGAMKISRSDFWQVADRTGQSLVLAAQEVPDFGVIIEWEDGSLPQTSEQRAIARQSWLSARYNDVERLTSAPIAGIASNRFAWVEVNDNERRESLMMEWLAGSWQIRLTAAASPAVWQAHGAQVLALFTKGVDNLSNNATPDAPAIETTNPNSQPVAPAEQLVIPSVINKPLPVARPTNLQAIAVVDGIYNLRHTDFWQRKESGTSYVMLNSLNAPQATAWIEWKQADEIQALENQVLQRLKRLREQYELVTPLPNRAIAGTAAFQIAYRTSEQGETQETLLIEWQERAMMMRIKITAPPQVWQQNEQMLRLLADIQRVG